MRWQDIDSRFPDAELPSAPHDRLARLDVVATHVARAALGLETRPLGHGQILGAVAEG